MNATPTSPLAGLDQYVTETQACRALAARLLAEHPNLPVHEMALGDSRRHPVLRIWADTHDVAAVRPWADLFGVDVTESTDEHGDRHVEANAVVDGCQVHVWVCLLAPLAVA